MKINRNKVHGSMWVPVVAVFFIMILAGFLGALFSGSKMEIVDFVGRAFFGILFGSIIWLPSAVICLIIERVGIHDGTTKSHLLQILFLEALVPLLIFNVLISQGDPTIFLQTLTIALLAQSARWFYLLRKNRLYLVESTEDNTPKIVALKVNPKS